VIAQHEEGAARDQNFASDRRPTTDMCSQPR
jgi:hypothetical protein